MSTRAEAKEFIDRIRDEKTLGGVIEWSGFAAIIRNALEM